MRPTFGPLKTARRSWIFSPRAHKKSVTRQSASAYRCDTTPNSHQKYIRRVWIDQHNDDLFDQAPQFEVKPAVVTIEHQTLYNADVLQGSGDSKISGT
jgi:hypothetical protein